MYLGDLHDDVEQLDQEQHRMEKSNKYKLIEQQKRETVLEKMVSDGAPLKSIQKIKELQDKMAVIKEGIRRESTALQRYDELMGKMSEQEIIMQDSEQKCMEIAANNKVVFTDGVEELT